MSKVTGFIKRHKVLTVLLVVVIIVAVIAVSCVSNINKALGELSQTATPNVTALSASTLENIVTATGTLESTDIRQVTTTYTAEVQQINVQVGDSVQAGDLLCVLDTSGVDKEIAHAEEDAADARALDSLNYSQAARTYSDAQKKLEDDRASDDKEVNSAREALDSIKRLAEDTAEAGSNRTALVQAREDTYNAWRAMAEEYGESSDEAWPSRVAYDEAYKAAEAAEAAYDGLYNSFAGEIGAAQSAYDLAVSQRDMNVRANENAVQNAKDALDRQSLSDNAKPSDRMADNYREQKDEMNIYAPISGRVTAVNAEVGVSAAGYASTATGTAGLSSGLFEIQNTDSMQIVTTVAEYDVVQLQNGMDVVITSDAMSGETWTGVVSSISPTATDANANFEVIVTVTSDPGILVPGMSARMNIIVEKVDNVYAVPFDAVVETEDGEQVVYQWVPGAAEGEAGEQRAITVQTGVENDYYIQIISPELEDGMEILNDPLGVNVNANFNMFGI